MTGEQIGSLAYLLLLGVVIAGWHFAANRKNLGRLAQQAAVWVFLFLGAIVAVGLWSDIRDTVVPRQALMQDGRQVVVPMAPDGHFYLTLEVNGVPVRFVVDTGASEVVLSGEDAARVGLSPDGLIFSGRAFTANGMVETAPVRLETVALGPHVDTGLRAVVNAGELTESLLGMSYLRRFQRLEISGGELVLER
ncbi:retropepsin-like aspartic protease family protein [Roseicyclus persicicus]|uniref:TIGR02281 family clan AA aspartic protease n=1 Tax=Roseicyclus persicicus TaxID=2650661 RepID=A0A7X6JWR6_9RHOB|nr:TIGR02281 family clan AA aspartic protease [Roseibacterium persicicum]NKX44742.1 TIGR02281 family clan AA aspartic protease [Roseibacterium persicicum]